jgi:release factor glutamine methyltransferase
MSPSIHEILSTQTPLLAAALSLTATDARHEINYLLQACLKVNRAYLLAHSERVLTESECDDFQAKLLRRLLGEPMAYILGEREFFGLNFKVTPATLIPRPDTELLVEMALAKISGSPSSGEPFRVLDLGTGSGAIALSIAHSCPEVQVTAVDFSAAALNVARENGQRLGLNNVSFIESDWFSALAGLRFDLIISNPPYISARDEHLVQGDVRFEPLTALVSGVDGLADIRQIARKAGAHCQPNASLLLEHGYQQAAEVRAILSRAGWLAVGSAEDLSGIERVSFGKWN